MAIRSVIDCACTASQAHGGHVADPRVTPTTCEALLKVALNHLHWLRHGVGNPEAWTLLYAKEPLARGGHKPNPQAQNFPRTTFRQAQRRGFL
jgi:hypothetical protein